MPTPIALLLFVSLCTGICYFVAKHRKANVPFWVVLGATLGPLAIPFVFFARPKAAKSPVR